MDAQPCPRFWGRLLHNCPCLPEWIGPERSEMWAVCTKCGARRVFLTNLDSAKARFAAIEADVEARRAQGADDGR